MKNVEKKKTATKNNNKIVKKISKDTKKQTIKEPKYYKYIYPSIVFGLMLAGFNYVFLILALYSPCYTGIYMELLDNVVLNVLINTIFQFLLFGFSFFTVSYLFLEVVIGKHN